MSEYFGKLKEKLLDKYFEVDDELIVEEHTEKRQESLLVDDESVIVIEDVKRVKNEVIAPSEPSILSLNTEIQGNISSDADLEIKGTIIGDVVTKGRIVIEKGTIIGNVRAKSILLVHAKVQGNIYSDTDIEICKNSDFTGNVTGQEVTIDNYCKGNVHALESLYLKAGASIKGDIHTKRLRIDEGAIVDGQIKMNK